MRWLGIMATIALSSIVKSTKLITISPAGYKGFFVLGICSFIKEHYDLSEYRFSGASAGAWNALFLCYRNPHSDLLRTLLTSKIEKTTNIRDLERVIKSAILENHRTEDFDLDRLSIGMTAVDGCLPKPHIVSDFSNLEDAIDACIASSHIPLVSGPLIHKYGGRYSFDGGFSKYPYYGLGKVVPTLHITPSQISYLGFTSTLSKPAAWYRGFNVSYYTSLFSRESYVFHQLFIDGYRFAIENRAILDQLIQDPKN